MENGFSKWEVGMPKSEDHLGLRAGSIPHSVKKEVSVVGKRNSERKKGSGGYQVPGVKPSGLQLISLPASKPPGFPA
jgi:hypothetical protein